MARETRNNRGFTLVELMITIAVLAVMIFALAPALGILSGSSRLELQNATEKLTDLIERAHTLSSMNNQAYEVVIAEDSDPQTVTLLAYPTSTCVPGPSNVPVVDSQTSLTSSASATMAHVDGSTAMFPDVMIVSVEPNTLTGLCFRPDGRMTDPAGIVIPAPEGTNLAAGEAQISMRMRVEQDNAQAITHQVIVPYNGITKVNYVLP